MELCKRNNRRIYFLDTIPITECFEQIRILKQKFTESMKRCTSEDYKDTKMIYKDTLSNVKHPEKKIYFINKIKIEKKIEFPICF